MAANYLNQYGRTLIDAMFHEQDQKLLKSFHERLAKLDQREQLARLCGINDETLLDHLVDLQLQPEAIAAIAVVPLVAVAWADGTVRDEERAAVIKAAEETGITAQDGRYPILEHWLRQRPGPEVMDAWKVYIAALCKQLDAKEVEELKEDLLNRAQAVAEAAGGILGITSKVSASERDVMRTLQRAFE